MTFSVTADQTDKLTGLPIYQAMSELLPVWFREGHEKTVSAASFREQGGVLVIFCDGDGLKGINDALGHDRGNDFIRALVERLKAHVPTICGCAASETTASCQNHFLARDGGDEFIVIIRDVLSEDAARGHVETLEFLMNELAFVSGDDTEPYVFPVTISFGAAWSNGVMNDGTPDSRRLDNPFSLKEDADTAMRDAKQHRSDGRRSSYFALAMWEEAVRRERLAALYWRAVHDGDYRVAFMPIVQIAQGGNADQPLFALEALARPSVPVGLESEYSLEPEHMEAFGVTTELLVGVLARVLDRLLDWRDRHGDDLPLVFVNVTPQLLVDDRIFNEVMTQLKQPVYAPVIDRLVFEFTEGSPLEAKKLVCERFSALRGYVKVALDDFGEGYANAITLVEFKWDVVKLDKAFLLKHEDRSRKILPSLIRLIHTLQPQALVLVEGVEDARRHRLVRSLIRIGDLPPMVLGQGYHYGRAMPESELVRRGHLAARRPAS